MKAALGAKPTEGCSRPFDAAADRQYWFAYKNHGGSSK